MTKEQAIERLKKMIQINNGVIKEARKNGGIFAIQLTADLDTDSIAIEKVLSMLEEKDKGINSLMQSRKKWKHRYYKMKNKNRELQKSIEQIYDDYQDIGKMAFNYSDKIEQQDKMIDLMLEEISNNFINTCPLEDYNYDLDCENKCNDNYKECWKQYFENKAKEVK